MMSEAVLQVLLILAYLAIGLISVTFPIYAICVTYLRQEEWETKKERKQRIQKLKKQIAKLTEELSGEKEDSEGFKEIQRRIKNYKSEKKNLTQRVRHLTAIGAVGLPVIFLVVALFLAGIGIRDYYDGSETGVTLCILGSVLSCGVAVFNLFGTISAVEHAALRPAHTVEFDVCYTSRQKTETIKLEEETKLHIGIGSLEEDVQNLQARIYIPPEIELKNVRKPAYATLQTKEYEFPHHNMIIYERDYLHKNIYQGILIRVLAKKTGSHKIPVEVFGEGIYEYKTELILNVVKKRIFPREFTANLR